MILCVAFLFAFLISGCGVGGVGVTELGPNTFAFTTYGTVRSVLFYEDHDNATRTVILFEYDDHPKSLARIEFDTVEPSIEKNMHVKLTYRQATLWEVGWVGRGEDPAYSQYDYRPIFRLLALTKLK